MSFQDFTRKVVLNKQAFKIQFESSVKQGDFSRVRLYKEAGVPWIFFFYYWLDYVLN